MRIVVVYESLWGNTAAIARAIAEGAGPSAKAFSTAEICPEDFSEADLIIAGAPVHSMSLPTETTRERARTGQLGPGGQAPDLSHPMMRTWLGSLPRRNALAAGFDTRVRAWYGRGAAQKITASLRAAGYQPIEKWRGFFVSGHPWKPTTDGRLCKGETERARKWGQELEQALSRMK